MNVKYCLILLLLPATLLTYAQSNYKEGTVITNNNAKLNGFINYREWHKNPDKIQFKKNLKDATVQSFTPDSIAGFSITGYESYVRYTVWVSTGEVLFQSLKDRIDTAAITKTVFLKLIGKGDRIDLYSYADEIKVRFYILDKRQTIPNELVYRKYISNGREITQALYRQQLAVLAQNYGLLDGAVDESISLAAYSGKDIRKIISKINTENETSNSVVIDKKRRWNLYLGVGVTGSKMIYKGESLIMQDGLDDQGKYKYKEKIITHSYLPRISTGVDFYFNPVIRRFLIRLEVSGSNIKSTVNSYYKFNNYGGNETDNTYQFIAWNFGFSPQLIYNLFNTKKYKWSLGAGFQLNNLAISKNSMERREHLTGNFIDLKEDYLPITAFSMTAIIRSGLLINDRIDLSLIWSSPTEYTDYIAGGQYLKTSLVSFTVGYYFKK